MKPLAHQFTSPALISYTYALPTQYRRYTDVVFSAIGGRYV
jgi:hypothetical protein